MCHPGTAYVADSTITVYGVPMGASKLLTIVLVLLSVDQRVFARRKAHRLTAIDHHEEGDPGYDLDPADFWRASSLGQVSTG